VWPETAEKVSLELTQLRRQVETYAELVAKVRTVEPNADELTLLAAFLHAFYNGIEGIFKRIAKDIDEELPTGGGWHAGLMALMTEPTGKRQAVVSKKLYEDIYKYMGFRHMFRHAYTYQLHWRGMADLVLNSEPVFDRLESELKAFFGPDLQG
jgi:hypothetical protein